MGWKVTNKRNTHKTPRRDTNLSRIKKKIACPTVMAALSNTMAILEGLITGCVDSCVDSCVRSTQDCGAWGCDCSLSLSRLALSRALSLARSPCLSLFPRSAPFPARARTRVPTCARAHAVCCGRLETTLGVAPALKGGKKEGGTHSQKYS
jgi:hypothetical protein